MPWPSFGMRGVRYLEDDVWPTRINTIVRSSLKQVYFADAVEATKHDDGRLRHACHGRATDIRRPSSTGTASDTMLAAERNRSFKSFHTDAGNSQELSSVIWPPLGGVVQAWTESEFPAGLSTTRPPDLRRGTRVQH